MITRRKFLKKAGIFVPSAFLIGRAIGQGVSVSDGPFLGGVNFPTELFALSGFGASRNNFTGQIGGTVTLTNKSVSCVGLGRYVISGNSQSHTLTIYDGSCVLKATAVLNTSGLSANSVHYVSITPFTMNANGVYWIYSSEISGQDAFLDGCTATGVHVSSVALTAVPCVGGTANFIWPVNALIF